MIQEIPINKIDYGINVRKEKDEDIAELAESIEQFDVLQPLIVRSTENGRYEVICGHRRYKALKREGGNLLVPCVIRNDIQNTDLIQVQLEENIQRKQMSALELVEAFDLMKKKSPVELTNKMIAKKLHKTVQWVENQYFAVRCGKKLYGNAATEIMRKKQMRAGQIIGEMQKKKREEGAIDCNGFRIMRQKTIITIRCDSEDITNYVISELKKI